MKPFIRFKTLVLLCLGLFSFDILIKAQSNEHIHLMVFELPIDSVKIVFDANYSYSVDVSSGDTLNVTGYSKGEIVTKNYINIPFVIQSKPNVVQNIKITSKDLESLPIFGIKSWDRLQKGYNVIINYDSFGTKIEVNGNVYSYPDTTLLLTRGVKQAKLLAVDGRAQEIELKVQDQIITIINAKMFSSEEEFRKLVIIPGLPFEVTNNLKKAKFYRVTTTVFASMSVFFLSSNMIWKNVNKNQVSEIVDGETLKKAELSHSLVKTSGAGAVISLTGLLGVYAMQYFQSKKLVYKNKMSGVKVSHGINHLTLTANF